MTYKPVNNQDHAKSAEHGDGGSTDYINNKQRLTGINQSAIDPVNINKAKALVIGKAVAPCYTPTSYIIYQDSNGKVHAVNGNTGTADWSSASSPATSDETTLIFNRVFYTLASTGGHVFLKNGTYFTNAMLNIGTYGRPNTIISLWGESRDNTILRFDANAIGVHLFKCYSSIDFRNFTIDSTAIGLQCINQQNGHYTYLENMRFLPGNEIGVYIVGSSLRGVTIKNCYFDVTRVAYDQLALTLNGCNVEYVLAEGNYFNKLSGTLTGSSFTSAGCSKAIIRGNVIDRTIGHDIFAISLENWGNYYRDILIENNIVNNGIIYLGGQANANITWENIAIQNNIIRGGLIHLDGGGANSNGCLITDVLISGNLFAYSNGNSIRTNARGYQVICNNTFRESNQGLADPNLGFASAINLFDHAQNIDVYGNTIIQTDLRTNGSPQAIRYSSNRHVKIHHNNFIKTNSGLYLVSIGTHSDIKVYDNQGYVTVNEDSTQFSGDGLTTAFLVSHGLNVTPLQIIFSTNQNISATVTAKKSSTFTVTFASAPASGTNNIIIDWIASKKVFA